MTAGVPAVMVVPETEEATALTKVVLPFRYATTKWVESRAATEAEVEETALRTTGGAPGG